MCYVGFYYQDLGNYTNYIWFPFETEIQESDPMGMIASSRYRSYLWELFGELFLKNFKGTEKEDKWIKHKEQMLGLVTEHSYNKYKKEYPWINPPSIEEAALYELKN